MAVFACACSCAGRATNVKAPASFPDGWYTTERCEGNTGEPGVYRLSRAGWIQLRGERVKRTEARFVEEGDGFAATYDAGPVHYLEEQAADGFFGISEESVGSAHLRAEGAAIKLRVVTTSPHTKHAFSCRLVPVTRPESERLDRTLARAEDPEHCARAAACCRALGGASACGEDEVLPCRTWGPICEGAPGIDPQRCQVWLGDLPELRSVRSGTHLPAECR